MTKQRIPSSTKPSPLPQFKKFEGAGPEHVAFSMKLSKNLTKNDYVILCSMLNHTFNEHYEVGNEFEFDIHSCVVGGIVMKKFPGHKKGQEKEWRHPLGHAAVRLSNEMDENAAAIQSEWPGGDMKSWAGKSDVVIHAKAKILTYVRTWMDAPSWTWGEVQLLMKCLKKFGIKFFEIKRKFNDYK